METILSEKTEKATDGVSRTLEAIARDNPSKLKLFEKIYDRKAAITECIEGQCLDCMGFDTKGIKECGDHRCPLHRFRPYQDK